MQVRFCETSETDYYRPQTKFAKIIFLHVTLILSTGGVVSQHALQVVSQHTLQVSGGGPSMPCRSPGPHPGGKLRGLALWGFQAHSQGGFQTHTQGGLQAHMWGSPGTQWGGGGSSPHPGTSPGPHLGGSPGTQWGAPGPHPVGSLRGLARGSPGPHLGEVEGSGLGGLRPTASGSPGTQWGASGPHTGEVSRLTPWGGGVFRPTPRGIPACTEADHPPTPQLMTTAAGGTHPTGMHSCVFMSIELYYEAFLFSLEIGFL